MHLRHDSSSIFTSVNAEGNRRRSASEGNQKQKAFGVRLTAWLEAGSPDGLRSISPLACERQRSHAPTRDPAPIQTTRLSGAFGIFGEFPHNLGTLPMTRKMPILASSSEDDAAGLGNDTKQKATTEFAAKAIHPNTIKTADALAFNAEVTGAGAPAEGTKSGTLLASG